MQSAWRVTSITSISLSDPEIKRWVLYQAISRTREESPHPLTSGLTLKPLSSDTGYACACLGGGGRNPLHSPHTYMPHPGLVRQQNCLIHRLTVQSICLGPVSSLFSSSPPKLILRRKMACESKNQGLSLGFYGLLEEKEEKTRILILALPKNDSGQSTSPQIPKMARKEI